MKLPNDHASREIFFIRLQSESAYYRTKAYVIPASILTVCIKAIPMHNYHNYTEIQELHFLFFCTQPSVSQDIQGCFRDLVFEL
jgi:hypothetical protein